jgi:diguanylate cyclase
VHLTDSTVTVDAAEHPRRFALSSVPQHVRIGPEACDVESPLVVRRPIAAGPRERRLRDPLTRLPTGDALGCELTVSGLARSVLVIAVDDLSHVNGALGRDGGDDLLIEVARRLSGLSGACDVVARLDGPEFAILLDDSDGRRVAARAQRVTTALLPPIMFGDTAVTPRFRIGTASSSSDKDTVASLVHNADIAAHINPSHGVEGWTPFMPSMVQSSTRRLAIESDISAALARGELSVVYQPIIDLSDGRIRVVEALSRWNHRTLGEVRPDEFVPAAERSGAIGNLTAWVLRAACTDLASWREASPGAANLRVSVNISPRCLAEATLPQTVAACLRDCGIEADRLILEITEATLNHADATAVANAHTLRATGVHLAIDDFGAGESSLARLARLPITHLKLDRCFLEHVRLPEHEAPLIGAIAAMAGELGIMLIVGGVETRGQLDLLRRYGCAQAQGYFFGRPYPAAHVLQLLTASEVGSAVTRLIVEPAA